MWIELSFALDGPIYGYRREISDSIYFLFINRHYFPNYGHFIKQYAAGYDRRPCRKKFTEFYQGHYIIAWSFWN